MARQVAFLIFLLDARGAVQITRTRHKYTRITPIIDARSFTMNTTKETVGWVINPDGRGIIGLLWNCFATGFLCTWSATHLNLPALDYSHFKTFK
ncbi:hypothetical protein P280DRAFT_470986 [Massarina eburnea CBS 473.64]|uniref:Secreted protein n=1 Tax=Massarina eburnea CBS 473.64 TaxID=1395130 RepID=A0A6A6RXP9_9PLEO|nr:hypothetical protein P280DRAFT_470986 [Massarina eburnea CBS 473.64]